MQRESLRMVPAVPFTLRESLKNDIVPLGVPVKGRDGKMMESIVISAGQTIVIDIMAYNRNKDLFGDDTDDFRPERWIENGGKLHKENKNYLLLHPH